MFSHTITSFLNAANSNKFSSSSSSIFNIGIKLLKKIIYSNQIITDKISIHNYIVAGVVTYVRYLEEIKFGENPCPLEGKKLIENIHEHNKLNYFSASLDSWLEKIILPIGAAVLDIKSIPEYFCEEYKKLNLNISQLKLLPTEYDFNDCVLFNRTITTFFKVIDSLEFSESARKILLSAMSLLRNLESSGCDVNEKICQHNYVVAGVVTYIQYNDTKHNDEYSFSVPERIIIHNIIIDALKKGVTYASSAELCYEAILLPIAKHVFDNQLIFKHEQKSYAKLGLNIDQLIIPDIDRKCSVIFYKNNSFLHSFIQKPQNHSNELILRNSGKPPVISMQQ